MSKKRDAILQEREKQWGDAVLTHSRIAQVWSGILGQDISAHQVALCMVGLKLVRAEINPDDPDGDDIEVVAWYDLDHLPTNPALRREVKNTNWAALRVARDGAVR